MIVFSDHAQLRFERRIGRSITLADCVRDGRIQNTPPGSLLMGDPADAYLIHGEAVFPLRRVPAGYLAVTCLRHRRLPKAERRARREAAHEDWKATA